MLMAEPALPIIRTVDEYLAWEEHQELRYEFVAGAITMMAGGTLSHDLIGMNTARALGNRLAGSPCRVHGSNLKVRSPARAVMYPDAFVRFGPGQAQLTVIEDPVLVVEVLSPGTQQGDLTEKRWAYQAIGTVNAILFVAADKARVELATRGPEGTWISRHFIGLETAIPLNALGIELPLTELYAGADLNLPET